MTLNLVQAVVVGENGHLLTTDGKLSWVVVVTREALDALAHRHDVTISELQEHSSTLMAIAERHLAVGDVSGRNRIWVFERDVEVWLNQAARRPVRRLLNGDAYSRIRPIIWGPAPDGP